MQSCSIHHWVLFFLTLTFTTGPTLAFTSVTVKLHQSATLPCSYKCSGVVTWTMFHKRSVVLAQCDQTSCRSEKGFYISHDQYVKGDVSLTLTAADYSKRGLYTIVCDGNDIRDVRLIIEILTSSVQLSPGEALLMDLAVPEPVEVIYKPMDSAGFYGEQICTVTERSLQCEAEYSPRTSLRYPELTLRDVNVSDSGSYTIRDRKNEEVIRIYTLFVKVVHPVVQPERKPVSHMVFGVAVGLLLLILLIVGAVLMVKERVKCLKQEKADLEETTHLTQSVTEVENSWRRAHSDADVVLLMRKVVEVDSLIQQYKPHRRRTLNDIPAVEVLKRKKAEMEDVLQSREISEQDTISQWWRLSRPELNTIIEHWRKYD